MNHQAMREELRTYYFEQADSRAVEFCDRCLAILDEKYEENMTPQAMKRLQYGVITAEMEPVLFANCPFYFEVGTMAARCDGARDFHGHRHPGGWTHWKNKHLFEDQDPELYALVRRQKKEKMYL